MMSRIRSVSGAFVLVPFLSFCVALSGAKATAAHAGEPVSAQPGGHDAVGSSADQTPLKVLQADQTKRTMVGELHAEQAERTSLRLVRVDEGNRASLFVLRADHPEQVPLRFVRVNEGDNAPLFELNAKEVRFNGSETLQRPDDGVKQATPRGAPPTPPASGVGMKPLSQDVTTLRSHIRTLEAKLAEVKFTITHLQTEVERLRARTLLLEQEEQIKSQAHPKK